MHTIFHFERSQNRVVKKKKLREATAYNDYLIPIASVVNQN